MMSHNTLYTGFLLATTPIAETIARIDKNQKNICIKFNYFIIELLLNSFIAKLSKLLTSQLPYSFIFYSPF